MKRNVWISAFVVSVSLLFVSPLTYQIYATSENKRPNFLIIVADDLGFSDIEPFGSEIHTPNLNQLADDGKLFTNFHVLPACSPTRSELLTGVDNHLNGLGAMYEAISQNQKGRPGYETYLNDRVITVADILKDSGYHTIMSGKWHLSEQTWKGQQPNTTNMEYVSNPNARGFDKTFTLLEGQASHFNSSYRFGGLVPTFLKNGLLTERPDSVYSSDLYTDEIMSFINEVKDDDKPLFMYLAFQVTHIPFEAPAETIEKHKGKYNQGWDIIRQDRFDRQKALGIWPEDMDLPERFPPQPAWNDSNITFDVHKEYWTRTIVKHAAMIDNMDYNVGRVIDYLKEIGEYDNTFILFTSDNGGANVSMGIDSVSLAPLSGFKGTMYEGGIRSPLIVKEPYQRGDREIIHSFTHVLDLVPTFLDYARVQHPTLIEMPFLQRLYGGSFAEPDENKYFKPTMGESLRPLLVGYTDRIHGDNEPISQELFGNSAVFMGDWKLVRHNPPAGDGKWRLYDITTDPAETVNLATKDKLPIIQRMLSAYDSYSRNIGLIPPDGTGLPLNLFGPLPDIYSNYTIIK